MKELTIWIGNKAIKVTRKDRFSVLCVNGKFSGDMAHWKKDKTGKWNTVRDYAKKSGFTHAFYFYKGELIPTGGNSSAIDDLDNFNG